ncbi:hypothetical protein EG328_001826 [Venturia inaequalis]|uniref:Aminoglycoside phosphotransferase domain-containing protein n=1 Tax=Venturia inaequalis TaxID=5025 RepID=A0A8H3UYY5_VENIN|nr:hypothetical protein EG328_001826 [Venturia inaequalis]
MTTRELLDRGPITYASASNKEKNIINQLAYVPATKNLYEKLWECRDTICALTSHHLRLSCSDTCEVLPSRQWLRGSFNVCIPVQVKSGTSCRKFILRCPMPHKLAESRYPGTVDEKLRCEVGTYAWMQSTCSDVRIPFLYGFGFSNQRHFTHEKERPFYIRLARMFWRSLYSLLRYADLSHYTPNPTAHNLPTAYMLLEHIDSGTGQMLSNTWDKWREDPIRQKRLHQGIAHLMLSLARIPQPRIGAFQFHDNCTVTLSNRPLTCAIMMLENDGTPRNIQRNDTYTCTEPFVSDMITLHDNYLLSNPNAVYDAGDCHSQMATRTLLRALSHQYIRKEFRNGPFLLQLSDFHASNIFVDEEWNITCLIDLEWVCALPVEMLNVPYWLTGCAIDGLREREDFEKFNTIRQEFMIQFEDEERKMVLGHKLPLARVMDEMWESKGVWFWYCLDSVNAMLVVLSDHVCPKFVSRLLPEAEEMLSRFWREDCGRIVEKKLADQERYDVELRYVFGEGVDGSIGQVAGAIPL